MSRFRVLVTADLHADHARSGALADELIAEINQQPEGAFDALLLVGDTATSVGDAIERCLAKFTFTGPKLYVPGNHELWTHGPDSYALWRDELPVRVRDAGWQWLSDEPYTSPGGDVAIVGSVGWYDYSFAQPELNIPRRFYAAKVSPGAAARYEEYQHLLDESADVDARAREIFARWNDGKFVKLHRSDEAFLDELLAKLRTQLDALKQVRHIIAAIHHLPFRALLPAPHSAQWDFAKAYLGSERLGELLLRYPNVRTVICGHSHLAVEAKVGHIHAINIGSGYRAKLFRVIEIE